MYDIKFSALYQIKKTSDLLDSDDTISWDEKWNKTYQTEIVKAVKLHAIYSTSEMFKSEINGLEMSDPLRSKLTLLHQVYVCDNIMKYCDGAFMDGIVNKTDMFKLKAYYEDIVEHLIPHMSVLAEGVSFSDETLHSQLGKTAEAKDYGVLYKLAADSRLNETEKLAGVDEYIKPLRSKLVNSAKL